MRWSEIGRTRCSVARTLAVIGDRWTLLVLRDAFLGVRRFEQFAESLQVSPASLTARLKKLSDHGLLERVAYQQSPRRSEYRLTEKGLDLYPVIVGLLRWGDRWEVDEGGPPVILEHRRCGMPTRPELVCSECGEPLDPREMRARRSSPGEAHVDRVP